MDYLTIAVVQPHIRQNALDWNLRNYNKLFKEFEAEIMSSDVLCLPEYWNGIKSDSWSKKISEQSLDYLEKIAKDLSIWIVGGSQLTKEEKKYLNKSHIFDPSGNLIGTYSKHHPFGFEKTKGLGKGKEIFVWNLKGWASSIRICSDMWVPGEHIKLVQRDIDLLFSPIMSSIPNRDLTNYARFMWHNLALIRSKESASIVAVSDWASQVTKEPYWTSGASCIADPSKKFSNNERIADNILKVAQKYQTILTKKLKLSEIREQREYRKRMGLIPLK